jgi:hypothetical protein
MVTRPLAFDVLHSEADRPIGRARLAGIGPLRRAPLLSPGLRSLKCEYGRLDVEYGSREVEEGALLPAGPSGRLRIGPFSGPFWPLGLSTIFAHQRQAGDESRSAPGLRGGVPSCAPTSPSRIKRRRVGAAAPGHRRQQAARAPKRRRRLHAAAASSAEQDEHVVTRSSGPAFRPCHILLALCGHTHFRKVRLLVVLRW